MDERPHRRLRDAGGTPGGLGSFLLGLGMAASGFDLLTNRIYVQSGWGRLWGQGKGGLLLLGVLLGFGLVFKSRYRGYYVDPNAELPTKQFPPEYRLTYMSQLVFRSRAEE